MGTSALSKMPPTSTAMINPFQLFLVLPRDLQYMIFTILLQVRGGNVITLETFNKLEQTRMLFELICVSQSFRELAMSVFYGVNKFDFSIPEYLRVYHYDPQYCNYEAPSIPPAITHRWLRNVHIKIDLTDSWVSYHQGHRNLENFRNPSELMRYCPGARVLSLLTDSITSLNYLDLHIVEDFSSDSLDQSISVYRAAGLVVRADHVNLTIENYGVVWSKVKPWWYSELADAIGIKNY